MFFLVESSFALGKVARHTMAQPKQITQETFDAVVRENMEEFEMDLHEAVQDAIDQFKTQGVDLSNLITSYVKDPDTGELKHSNPVKGEVFRKMLLVILHEDSQSPFSNFYETGVNVKLSYCICLRFMQYPPL